MYYPQIQSSLAAMDRVADVLEQKPKVVESSTASELNLSNTSMTFDNVTFEYIKDTFNDIDMQAQLLYVPSKLAGRCPIKPIKNLQL